MSLQQRNLLTLHIQVHLTCVTSAEFRELKLTWDNAQNSAHAPELHQTVVVMLILLVFFRYCSKAIPLSNGKIECTLKVRWGEFVGKGANKKSAKTTAAKLAVQALERSMDEPSE